MKNILKSSLLIIVLAASTANAQNDTTGWGRNSRFNMMYDAKSVTEINGEIIKIESVTPMSGMSAGMHITVRSEDKNYSVHLGPKWFLDNQSIRFNEKDKVKVKGSNITFEGSPAIIAMEVTKGTDVLKLRNPNGIPVWSRGRRR